MADFAPIGKPNKKPAIRAYVPLGDKPNIFFVNEEIKTVKYGIMFKWIMKFDIIMNGSRLGIITLNHSVNPYFAPLTLALGNMRIKINNKITSIL